MKFRYDFILAPERGLFLFDFNSIKAISSFLKASIIAISIMIGFAGETISQTLIPISSNNSVNSNTTLCTHAGCGINYNNNADGYTVLSAVLSNTITIIGSFATEFNNDLIRIYQGVGTAGTLLRTYSGNDTINYRGSAGQALTVRFSSNGSIVNTGLNATITYAPVPPSSVSGSVVSSTQIDASWSASVGADHYFVQIDTYSSFIGWAPGFVNLSAPISLYSFTGLTPGTTYYIHVAAVKSDGSWSGTTTSAAHVTVNLGENASNAQDLSLYVSPYSGTTLGYVDDMITCKTGSPDRVFYKNVPNGNSIDIWQSINNFDSYHYMGYGLPTENNSNFPGTQIFCVNDPDDQHNYWTNSTGATQRVWFIIDGNNDAGTFTLNWSEVEPCPKPSISGVPCSIAYVSNVTTTGGVTNFNNTSSCSSVYYTDYSATYSASQMQSGLVNMSFTSTGQAMNYAVWIDFNNDLIFSTSEKVLSYNNSAGNLTVNTSFTVPIGAALGTHKMRVRSEFYSYPVPSDPCAAVIYGETEDYSFEVVCVTPAAPVSLSSFVTGISTANISWSAGVPAGTSVNYFWKAYTQGGTLVSSASTSSTSASISGLTAGTSYYFTVYANTLCNGATSPTATSFNFTTFPSDPTSISATLTSICLGSPTSLTANGASGSVYWYTGSCGGTYVATGNPITVSPLATTTYYARNNNGNFSSGCASIIISVPALPSAPTLVSASPSDFCVGASSNLNATSNGSIINWYTDPTGGTLIGSSESEVDYYINPASSATYYAEAMSIGGASGSQTFDYSGSIVNFTVPVGITTLQIEARGAQGGSGGINSGGQGARIKGDITVTPGQVLKILVGQLGGSQGFFNGTGVGGGGGGTFVTDNSNNPLIIAGGGSGGGGFNSPANGNPGLITTSGGNTLCCSGGTAGFGGGAGIGSTGGGGLNTNGATTTCGLSAGLSFVNGGNGGSACSGGYGGFGGGSGGEWCCAGSPGAGGGYSGGAGSNGTGVSGGGGSINNGINQTNTSGFQAGNGQVLITWSAGASCPSASRTGVVVTVNPIPVSATLSPTPTAGAICSGVNVSAVVTAPGTGGIGTIAEILQYRFDGGEWATYTSGTVLSTSGHTSVDIQTYRTATGSGCTTSTPNMKSWTVSPLPLAISLTGSSICASPGGNGTITSNTSEIGVNYQLYTAANSAVQTPKPGTGAAIVWSTISAGNNYYVRATNTTSFCTSTSSTANVTPIANPIAPTGPTPQSFCNAAGSTVANLSATGTAIKWYATSSGGTALLPTVILLNNIHYYASQTSTLTGCESTSRLNVTVVMNLGIWYGTVNTDWNNAANWCGGIPTASTHVVISSGAVNVTSDISSPAACNNLTISAGASLTINAGKALTVNGILTNNAGTSGLIIKSNATGTGSLLNNTAGVSGSVEKYITQGDLVRHHFISSPIAAATTNLFSGYYMYRFDEPSNAWVNMAANQLMGIMEGYSVYKPNFQNSSIVKTFVGALNVGSIGTEQNLYRLSSGISGGWNLVGNPYASAIDWNSESWTKINIANSVYTWNQATNNYAYYVNEIGANGGTNIIPAMQGFMVKVDSIDNRGTLMMTNAIRVHDAHDFWKTTPQKVLRLTAYCEDFKDETVLRFDARASSIFDSEWDAHKLISPEGNVQIYTTYGGYDLAINSLAEVSKDLIIPLSLVVNQDGEYTITATGANNLEEGTTVYLQDLLLKKITNLNEKPAYVFNSKIDDKPQRFRLLFNHDDQNTATQDASPSMIYSFENSVYINTLQNAVGRIEVYDVLGKKLFSETLQNTTLNIFNLNTLATGYYVVKLYNLNETKSEKIFIK